MYMLLHILKYRNTVTRKARWKICDYIFAFSITKYKEKLDICVSYASNFNLHFLKQCLFQFIY